MLGNQREAIRRRDGLPQGIDQAGHDKTVVAERLQVDVPHGLCVAGTFFAKFHARRVGTPPGRSHLVLGARRTRRLTAHASGQGRGSLIRH